MGYNVNIVSSVVQSVVDYGGSGILVDIECQLANGLPVIIIIGFANKAVDEAKERVRSAFTSSTLDLPRKRITINLAPADIPKESTGFDLAIATSILLQSNQISSEFLSNSVVLGELGLDGSVRSVRGVIGKLLAAKKLGFKTVFVPKDNLKQALLVPGLNIVSVSTLRDLYLDLSGTVTLKRHKSGQEDFIPTPKIQSNFSDIVGQERAKRALEIAAAGNHNVLLSGPPGTGKSMLAKALPSILPPLSRDEILEVTQLHSLSTNNFDKIVVDRPFRAPHHSASLVSIVGGGQRPRPGEISLSHRGILFLDEIPEFSKTTLESLRQPLEDKIISVARAKDSISFPANFMLIATANPCPCGYYGTSKACSCLPSQIIRYQQKLSGPILDRIDLYVDVDEVRHDRLLSNADNDKSDVLKNSVEKARKTQQKRYKNTLKTNSTLTNREIKRLAALSTEAKQILDIAADKLSISARSYMRIIKVARTIADLEGKPGIEPKHITEALQYRKNERITL